MDPSECQFVTEETTLILSYLPSYFLIGFRSVSSNWRNIVDNILTRRIPGDVRFCPPSFLSAWYWKYYTAQEHEVETSCSAITYSYGTPFAYDGHFSLCKQQLYGIKIDSFTALVEYTRLLPHQPEIFQRPDFAEFWGEQFRSGKQQLVTPSLLEELGPLFPTGTYYVVSSPLSVEMSVSRSSWPTNSRMTGTGMICSVSQRIDMDGHPYFINQALPDTTLLPTSETDPDRVAWYKQKFEANPSYQPTVLMMGHAQDSCLMCYIIDGHHKLTASTQVPGSSIQALIFMYDGLWGYPQELRYYLNMPAFRGTLTAIRREKKQFVEVDQIPQLLASLDDLVLVCPPNSGVEELLCKHIKVVSTPTFQQCQVIFYGDEHFLERFKPVLAMNDMPVIQQSQQAIYKGAPLEPHPIILILADLGANGGRKYNVYDDTLERGPPGSQFIQHVITDRLNEPSWIPRSCSRKILLTMEPIPIGTIGSNYKFVQTHCLSRLPRMFLMSSFECSWERLNEKFGKQQIAGKPFYFGNAVPGLSFQEFSCLFLQVNETAMDLDQFVQQIYAVTPVPISRETYPALIISASPRTVRQICPLIQHSLYDADLATYIQKTTVSEFQHELNNFAKLGDWSPRIIPTQWPSPPFLAHPRATKSKQPPPPLYFLRHLQIPIPKLTETFELDASKRALILVDDYKFRHGSPHSWSKRLKELRASYFVIDSTAKLQEWEQMDPATCPLVFVALTSLLKPSLLPKIVLLDSAETPCAYDHIFYQFPKDKSLPLILTCDSEKDYTDTIKYLSNRFSCFFHGTSLEEFFRDEATAKKTHEWPQPTPAESSSEGPPVEWAF